MAERMDPEERQQLRMIADLLAHPGWPYLLAAWQQRRETRIIEKMKRARSETSWRYEQGRLEGFDEAISLPEFLAQKLDDEHDQRTASEEAAEMIKNLRGGPK